MRLDCGDLEIHRAPSLHEQDFQRKTTIPFDLHTQRHGFLATHASLPGCLFIFFAEVEMDLIELHGLQDKD